MIQYSIGGYMDKIFVKRCVSNKKAGIKSLHYYDNKIFLEYSFSVNTDILFSGEFEDVIVSI